MALLIIVVINQITQIFSLSFNFNVNCLSKRFHNFKCLMSSQGQVKARENKQKIARVDIERRVKVVIRMKPKMEI